MVASMALAADRRADDAESGSDEITVVSAIIELECALIQV
jgi:hypothetical protein